jgi:regulator of sigma E protease
MAGEDDPAIERSLAAASKLTRLGVMVAGSFMNLLLAVIAFALLAGLQGYSGEGVRISGVAKDSPGAGAGIQPGDIVLSADQTSLNSPDEMIAYTKPRAGQEITLHIRRAGAPIDVPVTPRFNEQAQKAEIGLFLSSRTNWGEAILDGARQTAQVVILTFSVPVMVIRGVLPLETVRPTGPVGIAQLAGSAVQASLASGGWLPVLYLMGLLSTALAVTNLLPLPALDGGRVLFLLIETIRRKRIKPEMEGAIHLIGFACLLALMVAITYMDITSPLPAVDWGRLF